MSYFAQTRWGETIDKPTDKELDELLDSLVMDDDDHPHVCVVHESGWTLSVSAGGLVTWSNPEGGDAAKHMSHQSRQQTLSLWHSLARGETEALDTQAWQDGDQPDD